MHWAQHGEYTLDFRGDVLVVRYVGDWNTVASANLHRDAQAFWQARNGRPWGLFSDGRAWGGATPEALERWWQFFEDAQAHGLTAVTDIMPTRLHAMMVASLVERGRQLVCFTRSSTEEAAFAWLAEQGFAAS